MAALLEEADEIVMKKNTEWPPKGVNIEVKLRDGKGRYVEDDLADYQRGRRRLW